MSQYEKPKRGDGQEDDEFALIVKHFYWRLFLYVMTPAVVLGVLLWIPVIILNNLPDRTHAQCTVYNDDYGIRIVSETTRVLTMSYYWTDNHGESWQFVHSETHSYQLANADCDAVSFSEENTTQILDNETEITITPSGRITIQAVVQ